MTAATTDWNLLFGAIALQLDLISKDQLVTAMTTWVVEKQSTLGALLVRQGALTESRHQLLQALVQEHIDAHAGNANQSLAAVGAFESVREGLEQIGDAQFFDTLPRIAVGRSQSSSNSNASVSKIRSQDPDRPPTTEEQQIVGQRSSSTNRFRILRTHAEGGLGRVLIAHDQELNREVALKEIKKRFADDENSRARFMLEAEITGRLEHPGIVPVYGSGEYPDGRPYYAMRFIRGESLRQAIDRFHASLRCDPVNTKAPTMAGSDDKASTIAGVKSPAAANAKASRRAAAVSGSHAFTSVEFRKLLGRFVSVCHAVAYAHSRGILHRDLKPSNIMLWKYGETLLVDWGLAKAAGRDDMIQESGELTLNPNSGSNIDATRHGAAMGTPSYMSPEQAAGDSAKLSPQTDVYGLGATLYHLLTGQPPFKFQAGDEVTQRIVEGSYPRIREVVPGLPRPLAAICARAMALNPLDRYRSPTELADDLEHWLADERVAAHHDSLVERSGRWMRRHRSVVQATIATLTLFSATAVLAALLINHSREEAEGARRLADAERSRALNLAEQKTTLAAEMSALAFEKAALAAQKSALAEQNSKLAQDERQEADKSRRLSEFLISIFRSADPIGQGGATFFIPSGDSDKLTARQILGDGTARVRTDNDLANYPVARAAIMDAIGDVYRQLGMFQEAEPLLLDALQLRRDNLPPGHSELAASYHHLGWYYHERGDFPRAMELYQQALDIRRELPGEEGQRLAANTMHNIAWMLSNEGKSKQAERIFREAVEIRQSILGPTHRDVVFSRIGVAFALIEQGRWLEATPLILAAKDQLVPVEGDSNVKLAVTHFALGVIYRHTLGLGASENQLRLAHQHVREALGPDNIYTALVEYELAVTLVRMRRRDEAESLLRHCLQVARSQVQLQHPRVLLLVISYSNLLRDLKRGVEAVPLWEEFVAAQESRFGPLHGYTIRARIEQAVFLRLLGRREEARKQLEPLLEDCRHNTVASAPAHLPRVLTELGLVHLHSGRPIDAEPLLREALSLTRARTDIPDELEYETSLALSDLARALLRLQQWDEARERIAESELLARRQPKDRDDALEYLLEVAAELYRGLGDHVRAAQASWERRSLDADDPHTLIEVARELCDCLVLCEADRQLSESDRQTVRSDYREKALQSIRDARSVGYTDLEALRGDRRLAPLRDLPEFSALPECTP